MNIWLISLFDPTPLDDPIYPRFIGIAQAACRRGNSVTHFTSTFRHTIKKHRFDDSKDHRVSPGYEVVFTRSMGYKRNISPKRFIAHFDYANQLIKAFQGRPKPDVIFISMPPLSTIAKVTQWGKVNNVPVVIDIIDPWPDSFIKDVPTSLKPLGRILLTPFYQKLRRSFARSTAITAISNGYLKWARPFHSKQKPTRPFFLAIDFEDIRKSIEAAGINKPPGGPLRLIYAGSLASSYDIPSILKAAQIIEQKHPGKTKFVITGKGPQRELIQTAKKKTSNIEYLGWVSREELIRQYALADIGLIQHKNSLTQTITYKFFNYMSAGLPLLNSLQSEMAELIVTEGLGLNNKEEDVAGLVENIERYLMNPTLLKEHSENALVFTAKFGDTKAVYGELVKFLEQLAKAGEHVSSS